MNESVGQFIALCIDNYNNGGHSSTKEQEHKYHDLKHEISQGLNAIDHINEEINTCNKMYKLAVDNSSEPEQRYWDSRKIDFQNILAVSS